MVPFVYLFSWGEYRPVAGWGYGALGNNQTDNFHALLYGHMATYQSRGTFHTTEQLGFYGEGLYRQFLHWPNDPLPPLNARAGDLSAGGLPNTLINGTTSTIADYHKLSYGNAGAVGLDGETRLSTSSSYYGNENDISFCIVTQVLVSRLTRWQLVFEDIYRATSGQPTIWLGRGAPARWFVTSPSSEGGFSVAGIPSEAGLISYNLTVATDGLATYAVEVVTGGEGVAALYSMRWPGTISGAPKLFGCEMVAVESGVVTVRPTGPTIAFSTSATFSLKQN